MDEASIRNLFEAELEAGVFGNFDTLERSKVTGRYSNIYLQCHWLGYIQACKRIEATFNDAARLLSKHILDLAAGNLKAQHASALKNKQYRDVVALAEAFVRKYSIELGHDEEFSLLAMALSELPNGKPTK